MLSRMFWGLMGAISAGFGLIMTVVSIVQDIQVLWWRHLVLNIFGHFSGDD